MDFTSDCTNLDCTFTDTSSDTAGSITTRSWTFSDPAGTSTGQNPSHKYLSGGTYTVTLTVTDSENHTSSVSHNVTVSAAGAPKITGTSCFGGATCNFTATGWGTLTWVGATGSTATGSTATKTYTSPGSYAVTVTNTAGSDSTSVSCVWNGHSHNKTLSCS